MKENADEQVEKSSRLRLGLMGRKKRKLVSNIAVVLDLMRMAKMIIEDRGIETDNEAEITQLNELTSALRRYYWGAKRKFDKTRERD